MLQLKNWICTTPKRFQSSKKQIKIWDLFAVQYVEYSQQNRLTNLVASF